MFMRQHQKTKMYMALDAKNSNHTDTSQTFKGHAKDLFSLFLWYPDNKQS